MNLRLQYIKEAGITEQEYLEFLTKYHGGKAIHKAKDRRKWYEECNRYDILLAILDDRIVGQACYYEVTAVSGSEHTEIPLSWGVDTFVLSEARGKGIGKKLQNKLHKDCINFSSLWYSPTNGIIKRKCGANEFGSFKFSYYPVSKFLGVYLELAILKLLKKKIIINSSISKLYYILNKKSVDKFKVKELHSFSSENVEFIKQSLDKNYDFYIKRDLRYLNWKYFENPTLKKIHILEIYNEQETLCIVSFSEIQERTYLATKYKGITILDLFLKDCKKITNKEVINIVTKFYLKQGKTLDGISTIFNIPYFPKITYPSKGVPFLSTYIGKIENPYFSYMDQDMEQI